MREYNLDRNVIRASGGVGGVPCLAKGKQRRGSKGKIKDRWTARAAEGKTDIDTGLIEKAKA